MTRVPFGWLNKAGHTLYSIFFAFNSVFVKLAHSDEVEEPLVNPVSNSSGTLLLGIIIKSNPAAETGHYLK